MNCLRIYATPDGHSHFGEIDIPLTKRSIFLDAAPFELSAHYPAQRLRFTRIPQGMREVAWHKGAGAGAHRAARRRRRVRDERRRGAPRAGRRLRAVGGHARQGPHLPPFRRGADRPLDSVRRSVIAGGRQRFVFKPRARTGQERISCLSLPAAAPLGTAARCQRVAREAGKARQKFNPVVLLLRL